MAKEPLDMRTGADTALVWARMKFFGAAHPHTAYLSANRWANLLKVPVLDLP